MASPARFELTTFRLGGGRSILLSYEDTICGYIRRGKHARQEELYRSSGGVVNQSGDEFGAARGDQLPLRPVGAAVRGALKLGVVHARSVDRAGAELFYARGIDLVVLSGGDDQRRAVDLVQVSLEFPREPAEIDKFSRGEPAVHLRVGIIAPGGLSSPAFGVTYDGNDRAERARDAQIAFHLNRRAD